MLYEHGSDPLEVLDLCILEDFELYQNGFVSIFQEHVEWVGLN